MNNLCYIVEFNAHSVWMIHPPELGTSRHVRLIPSYLVGRQKAVLVLEEEEESV